MLILLYNRVAYSNSKYNQMQCLEYYHLAFIYYFHLQCSHTPVKENATGFKKLNSKYSIIFAWILDKNWVLLKYCTVASAFLAIVVLYLVVYLHILPFTHAITVLVLLFKIYILRSFCRTFHELHHLFCCVTPL